MDREQYIVFPASVRAIQVSARPSPEQMGGLPALVAETMEAQMAESFFHNAILGQCPIELTRLDTREWCAELVWYEMRPEGEEGWPTTRIVLATAHADIPLKALAQLSRCVAAVYAHADDGEEESDGEDIPD